MFGAAIPSTVIPAQAGIHVTFSNSDVDGGLHYCVEKRNQNKQTEYELAGIHVDPGLRRDDGRGCWVFGNSNLAETRRFQIQEIRINTQQLNSIEWPSHDR